MGARTVVDDLFARARASAGAPALVSKREGVWQTRSWADYAERVRHFARGLIELGHTRGRPIAILSWNREEWLVAQMAAMAAGGVGVGIYLTSSPDETRYILEHSESFALVVEDADRWRSQVRAYQDEIASLEWVILMDGEDDEHDRVVSFDRVEASGREADPRLLEERLAAVGDEDPATLIYTSGTTGPPKAVVLSHQAVRWSARQFARRYQPEPDERLLSFLPLSHVAEQMCSVYIPLATGYSVHFAESMERLKDNLLEVRPELFFAVPRLWEKFHAAMADKLRSARGAKRALLRWARWVGSRAAEPKQRGEPLGLRLAAEYFVAERLVYSKFRRAVGFDRMRIVGSGGGPIDPKILEFFLSFGLLIYEGYALSETCGTTTFNYAGHTRVGTVGTVFEDCQVKIADDGEILFKGPSLFSGYLKDAEATGEALVDGWLHTGDLGALDPDGYLSITGRKKDLIITAGGKNIAPQNIERLLAELPGVEHAVCIGDRRPYLTALLTIDPDALASWAATHLPGEDGLTAITDHPAFREAIERGIEQANTRLARVEQVKRYAILTGRLSSESGELTPTLKLRRHVLSERHRDVIEAMYAGQEIRSRSPSERRSSAP